VPRSGNVDGVVAQIDIKCNCGAHDMNGCEMTSTEAFSDVWIGLLDHGLETERKFSKGVNGICAHGLHVEIGLSIQGDGIFAVFTICKERFYPYRYL